MHRVPWYNDGEDKMRRRVWILDHAILIAFGDKLFIADKETFKMSHVDLPEAYYDKITYHFVPGEGLMIQILVENVEYETDSEDEKEKEEEESYVPTYSVWVGHISMKFLPKGEWRGNFEVGPYVCNTDESCYFAKVDSFFPTSYYTNGGRDPDIYFYSASYTFSEDGSVLMIIGKEELTYLCVIGLGRENTGVQFNRHFEFWAQNCEGTTSSGMSQNPKHNLGLILGQILG